MKKLIFLLAVPQLAHAGGLAVGEQNAVSAGTAGAGAARDDDPGAAWHDPAALADGGGWRVGFSLVGAHPSVQTTSARSEERRVGKECRSRWSPYNDTATTEIYTLSLHVF